MEPVYYAAGAVLLIGAISIFAAIRHAKSRINFQERANELRRQREMEDEDTVKVHASTLDRIADEYEQRLAELKELNDQRIKELTDDPAKMAEALKRFNRS